MPASHILKQMQGEDYPFRNFIFAWRVIGNLQSFLIENRVYNLLKRGFAHPGVFNILNRDPLAEFIKGKGGIKGAKGNNLLEEGLKRGF